MTIGLAKFDTLDDEGSFLAEGRAFKYSFSTRSGVILISDKSGSFSYEARPPYPGAQNATEFLLTFEKASQTKALRMSAGKSVNIMDMMQGAPHCPSPDNAFPSRDAPLMFREIENLARMTHIAAHNDHIKLAEEITRSSSLRGVEISREESGGIHMTCVTVLGNEIDVSAESLMTLVRRTGEVLGLVQATTSDFMRVAKPPLVEGVAGTMQTLAMVLDPSPPELSYRLAPSIKPAGPVAEIKPFDPLVYREAAIAPALGGKAGGRTGWRGTGHTSAGEEARDGRASN